MSLIFELPVTQRIFLAAALPLLKSDSFPLIGCLGLIALISLRPARQPIGNSRERSSGALASLVGNRLVGSPVRLHYGHRGTRRSAGLVVDIGI